MYGASLFVVHRCGLLAVVFLFALGSAKAQLSTKLLPETNRMFESYVLDAEREIGYRPASSPQWLDSAQTARVRKGDTIVLPVLNPNPRPVKGGLIHDWVGGTLFRGATVEQVSRALTNFDRHKQWYPEVIDSRTLSEEAQIVRGAWVLRRTKVITVVLRVQLTTQLSKPGDRHFRLVSRSDPIVEVQEYGERTQRDYPPGEGHGFLWRFNAYWSLKQEGDNVLAECRTISLSREIPSGLTWIVNPFIRSIPKDTLTSTLENTKAALGKTR